MTATAQNVWATSFDIFAPGSFNPAQLDKLQPHHARHPYKDMTAQTPETIGCRP